MLRSQVVQAEISAFMYKYQFGRRVKKVWDDKEILYPKQIKKKKLKNIKEEETCLEVQSLQP